jgi:hypothetical protein
MLRAYGRPAGAAARALTGLRRCWAFPYAPLST